MRAGFQPANSFLSSDISSETSFPLREADTTDGCLMCREIVELEVKLHWLSALHCCQSEQRCTLSPGRLREKLLVALEPARVPLVTV